MLQRHNEIKPLYLFAYLAVSALMSTSVWILLLLPNFLQEQGWSSQAIGWVMGTFFLCSLVFQLVSGPLVDRFGSFFLMFLGISLACLGGLAYLSALWIPGLIFLGRIGHAAGLAMLFSSTLTQLVKSVPIELRGRMIGYFGTPGLMMLAVGPLLSEWLVERWGFEALFFLILLIFPTIAGILSRLPKQLRNVEVSHSPFRAALQENVRRLKPVLMLAFCFGIGFSVWNSFLAPAVAGVGTGAVSNFGMGYGVGALLTRLGISHRLDFGNRRLLAILSLIPYGLALAFIPHLSASWQLMTAGLACGMGHGVFYPSLSSFATERFNPAQTGQGMSLYFSAAALGTSVGSPLWGFVADQTSYDVAFCFAGLVLIGGALIFMSLQWQGWESLTGWYRPRLKRAVAFRREN